MNVGNGISTDCAKTVVAGKVLEKVFEPEIGPGRSAAQPLVLDNRGVHEKFQFAVFGFQAFVSAQPDAVAKAIGLDQSVMSRFMAAKSGLSVETIDRLGELLGLTLSTVNPKMKGKAHHGKHH